MNADTIQPLNLLALAAALPVATVDKMAHALGWPDHYQTRNGKLAMTGSRLRGRLPRKPRRNYYCGARNDADWQAAVTQGLAELRPTPPHWTGVEYVVTPLGIEVVRLRVIASLSAAWLREGVTP